VASAERQAAFIARCERLTNELSDDEAVYFADVVHRDCRTECALGRTKSGSNPAVKITAGRESVNIQGARDLETFDAPLVEPDIVDGASATQLLAWIEPAGAMRKLKDGDGRHLWAESLAPGQPPVLLGYPVTIAWGTPSHLEHVCLHEAAQGRELFGQIPRCQRRRVRHCARTVYGWLPRGKGFFRIKHLVGRGHVYGV
jgi:hypothetical protein